ncbi:hypothetical protein EXH44_06290 [Actinobacillus indolicus]|uniref:Uncharacterized protein n=1 Tax=Actinobacillus indolicus TaxID=51049 RepID=A0A4P7CFT9_9PAST|nr:hypothetical protein [Actinobacillus indolicus]QBQ63868.1 hypothetical protein EXH44_06290 [Actinobacillus indolicus]
MKQPIYPTRKAKAIKALLEHPQGISGREIDFKYFINCGRNEVTELPRLHNIAIHKIKKPNQHGTGTYTIYSLLNAKEALKAITLLNGERAKCGLPMLTEYETQRYLSQFRGTDDRSN